MSDVYKYDADEILSPDEEVIHEQNKIIERLQKQLESAQDVIYEYIKIYGVERECSKYLEKYAERTK